MNELITIINLSQALSKSFAADIVRLDIHYNAEKDITQAYLYLEGAADIAKITGHGEVTIYPKNISGAAGIEEEIAPAQPETTDKEETAAEAMEAMKVATDKLQVPTKPKALTVVPEGKARYKEGLA